MPTQVPPGPRSFLGLGLARRFRTDPLGFTLELARTHGDLVYFRAGPYRCYLASHPDLVQEVLVARHKHFRKQPRTIKILRKIDGNGLVLTEGDFWLRQRRLVQPAFHPRRMARYAETTVALTRRMLQGWPERREQDIAEVMTHLTLEIIARTLFDVELTGQAAQLGEAVRIFSETAVRENSSLFPLPDWLPLPSKRRKRWAIRTLDTLIWDIIRERRASGGDRGDLLSMLLLAVD